MGEPERRTNDLTRNSEAGNVPDAVDQRFVEPVEKAEMIEFLTASQKDADAGRTVPAREFLESLRRESAPG